MDYDLSVFIGRIQPFHNEHLNVLKQGLKLSKRVLVIIGSADSARTIKNPFTYEQRKQMIEGSLTASEKSRVLYAPVSDYFYNDNQWVASIQNIVNQYNDGGSICLLGSYKDASSYYLNLFPQWDFKPVKAMTPMDATSIRNKIFDPDNVIIANTWHDILPNPRPVGWISDDFKHMIPKGTLDIILSYVISSEYCEHVSEYKYIQEYKKSWEAAPFSPTFVTADTVVVKSGHILLIKRKFSPGKGLYALPGGFIKQDETIESAAIRELKEETRIKVDKPVLKSKIKDSKLFDFPNRSLRGRTITNAYFIDLGQGELPEVKANDDASGAYWITIGEFMKMSDKMFEDHSNIACYFLMKGI